jgi:hypothetical protein
VVGTQPRVECSDLCLAETARLQLFGNWVGVSDSWAGGWVDVCVFVVARSFVASISGLVVEYIVAIDVTRVRFPADACDVAVCVLRFRVSCACPARPSSTNNEIREGQEGDGQGEEEQQEPQRD